MAKTPSRVFVDANVVLTAILNRTHNDTAQETLYKYAGRTYLSALSAHLVVYFGSKEFELPVLRRFLADFVILPLVSDDFEWAFANMRNGGFEDALQLAVALNNSCDTFITLDRSLYRTYQGLPELSVELLK